MDYIRQMNGFLYHSRGTLDVKARAVYTCLFDIWNRLKRPNGWFRAANSQIMRETCIKKEQNVINAKKALERGGYIRTRKRARTAVTEYMMIDLTTDNQSVKSAKTTDESSVNYLPIVSRTTDDMSVDLGRTTDESSVNYLPIVSRTTDDMSVDLGRTTDESSGIIKEKHKKESKGKGKEKPSINPSSSSSSSPTPAPAALSKGAAVAVDDGETIVREDKDFQILEKLFLANNFTGHRYSRKVKRQLLDLYEEYGKDLVARSIAEAIFKGGKSLAYCKTILERWKAEGCDFQGVNPLKRYEQTTK